MHALRYGTIPVAHRTGGLADTIRDESESPGRGTGFLFSPLTPETLTAAVRRALELRRAGPAAWRALQERAMAERFSWEHAAGEYARLYSEISR
jgi:starch synthase